MIFYGKKAAIFTSFHQLHIPPVASICSAIKEVKKHVQKKSKLNKKGK